jgi:UDPglucose 6-dehydrogenase
LKLCFLGTSHAAQHLSLAAKEKGFKLVEPKDADLVFVSEDTPTDAEGHRDLGVIKGLVAEAFRMTVDATPIVLTSAVPPGFTRALGLPLWHQAETLRIKDAVERARKPEMLIVGEKEPGKGFANLPAPYVRYLLSFKCPVLRMTWEEAEFAKIAINMTLASQVENTNRLSKAAEKVGARWDVIAEVLKNDSRIGPKSYLQPGDWRESPHLLRDWKTLEAI